ncbi:MAG: diguanylate cyclase [Candidatus Brocadiaceae bacterium]|nr:diguanylate cyclase [Candidatus Brocadiaceae bacterium]
MGILIVDDSENIRSLLEYILKNAGYEDIFLVESAPEAFGLLGMKRKGRSEGKIDLVLMDISLPEIDGIEACRQIKEKEFLRDIPIIMVTGKVDDTNLQMAFEAGAVDYLTKPINKVELLARVCSSLKLKQEMDKRKEIAQKLEEANRKLQILSSLDGLTGISNRRHFDEVLDKEWRRAFRNGNFLSVILMDIDFFKSYNDNYGHQAGDDCLTQIAGVIHGMVRRPGDLVARYGGEEFVIILPETALENASKFADTIRSAVESRNIPHVHSSVSRFVTCSLGVAAILPGGDVSPQQLIAAADKALYQAKEGGRNRVKVSGGGYLCK